MRVAAPEESAHARAAIERLPAALAEARAAYARGDMRGTLDALEPSLGWSEARSGPLAQALLFTSNALLRLGDAGQAGACAEDALRILPRDERYLAFEASLHGARGRALHQIGLVDLAFDCFARERHLVGRAFGRGDPVAASRVGCHLDLARSLLARESFAELEQEVEGWLAEPSASMPGSKPLYDDPAFATNRAALWLYLGVAQHHLERLDPARERRAETTLAALAEAGPSGNERFQARQWLACLLLRDGRPDAADEVARACAEDGRAGAVVPTPDEALFQAVLDGWIALDVPTLRDRATARDALERRWEEHVRGFEALAPRKGGLGVLQYGRSRMALTVLARLHAALDGERTGAERALADLARVQSVSSLARDLGGSVADLAHLRACLAEREEGHLAYVFGPDTGHVLVLDQDELALVFLPGTLRLEPVANDLVAQVSRSPAGLSASERERRARRIEHGLSELERGLLTGAVTRGLGRWRAVGVSGLETLGPVPFELLRGPGGEALGRALAVTRVPSLPALIALYERGRARGDRRIAAGHVLALGAEVDEGLLGHDRLRLDAAERARVGERLGGAETVVLAGRDARFERLRAALDAGTLALTLLTHGLFDGARERPAGLLLSADETRARALWCEDLETLRLPPLVVLGACGAGRAPSRAGDAGSAGFEGACLLAGAQSVVLSDSNLSYRATLELTAVFFERVGAGDPPDEALRAAREALAGSSAWSDPFYWGLISVRGLAREPLFPRADAAPKLWWILAAAALGALLWIAPRRLRRSAR